MKRLGVALLVVLVAASVIVVAATAGPFGDRTELSYDGDRMNLDPGPEQAVSGQTDLEPGTTVQVRVASAGNSEPFLKTENATVTDDGSFEATFDLRDVADSSANVTVRHDGSDLATASATIAPCDDDCEEEQSASDDESGEQTPEITVDHDGDAVTVAAEPAQEITGESQLDPGTELHVRVESVDSSQPFLITDTTTVDEDGTFSATFDMRDVAEDSNGSLVIEHDGTELVQTDVRVEGCDGECEAEESESNEEDENATIDHSGDALSLEAGPAQEISGETNLEAGTELRLQFQSVDQSQPFFLQERVNVTEDGTFATTTDLTFIDGEQAATLTVSANGNELSQIDVVITPCEEYCEEESSGNDVDTTEFGLAEEVVSVSSDETAKIPVALGDADTATLRVGGDDTNYAVTATGTDGNDDGLVTFVVDPSAPGNETATLTAADGDDVSVESESSLDGALDPAEYDISLYSGSSTDGDPDDIGTLVVLSPDE